MKRRDFFRLRSSGHRQIMMLSCQHLYMGYNDARSQLGNVDSDLSSNDEDWWSGEPPLAVESLQVEQLFTELKEQIAQADVLILEHREWLQDDEFSRLVNELLSQFRADGGELRYSTKDSEKTSIVDSRQAV